MNPNIILPFRAIGHQDVPLVGGKGASLGEMSRARFPVPPGFCVTTAAFRQFMKTAVAAPLYQLLAQIPASDVAAARAVGETIRRTLRDVPIPDEITAAVTEAWQNLGAAAVAVRSSATAEDLPEASFAGQQDTFLNVRNEADLLTAVRDCWISLFTDRAILYRQQNNFVHQDVALSVVVQQMVQPDVSGILFTADPVSGHRQIASIDASYGLGEALVAGLVEPDVLRVDKGTLRVLDVQLGKKEVAIRPLPNGRVQRETVPRALRAARALSNAQAALLTDLGNKIETHYGMPQDIEWAIAGGKIYILQSRPITSLFPLPPEALRTDTLKIMFSFGAVQGMLDPMTPIGQDTMRGAFAGGAQLFAYQRTIETQNVIWTAAERLFLNFTPLFRHPIGRRVMQGALNWIEAGSADTLRELWQEPDFQPQRGWFNADTLRRVIVGFGPMVRRLVWTLRYPDAGRQRAQALLQQTVDDYTNKIANTTTLTAQLAVADHMMHHAFRTVVGHVLPVIAGGMASLNLLNQLAKRIPGMDQHALTLTRGLPYNVTTQMDLALWRTAQTIQADRAAAASFANTTAGDLAQQYLDQTLPTVVQTAVSEFLSHYGMRGLAEIDLGRPRWRENPTPVMQALQSYLRITDPAHAPDAVFAQGETAAADALAELTAAAHRTRFGQVKVALIRTATKRLRALAGLRESPKFYMVQLFGLVREALLQSGAQLAAAGVLARADDVTFLRLAELHALAAGEQRDWPALIAQRRAAYAREQQRRQIPRLLLSDGRAFFAGVNRRRSDIPDGAFVGSAVSPGVVEGRAHVVFDPHEAQLAPGEILVCPGTDPAWTPLFLAAGGLVMEVGGLMTHGSVVAREYGIPAVVGVQDATQQLKTGQWIRVDGAAGIVEVLEE